MDNRGYEHEENKLGMEKMHIESPNTSHEGGKRNKCHRVCQDNIVLFLTFAAVVLGFAIGFGLREAELRGHIELSDDAKTWIGMPGYIFLNLLKMLIVPLIVASVISAVATLEPDQNGQVGGVQLAYLVLTNILGATIGTAMAFIFKPGKSTSSENVRSLESLLGTSDIFADLVRNIFPNNIVRSTMEKVVTSYGEKENNVSVGNDTFALEMVRGAPSLGYTGGTNILGLMFISLLFGLATSKAGAKGKPFLDFFQSALDIIIILLQWFMWVVPIGILSLVILAIYGIGDLKQTFTQLGLFVAAVVVGLAIHQIIFVPLIFFAGTRRNPVWLYVYGVKAWLVGFASTSMAVAMPYIYQMQQRRRLEWDRRVSNFAIPMAVALSKDGSAIFIAVSCFFLAQLEGITLTVGNGFVIWILVGTASLAIPPVPSSSIVAIIIVCSSIGIPTTEIGLLFTVEWLLDRLRTTGNLMSNLMSISFTNHFFLKKMRRQYGSGFDLQM